ncbi:hypothetical protein [Microlunatus sp. Gsoil 973]|uniref:hypothetical protein n=1 Tax=Microlunatus sp. Gsoil 973 TaxID=2672569 RepID=UPI0012B4CDF7|nr:hypothetical protein [Microlunatus sp. Gsoil 973]QGN32479.1 hypothetical protein GJV80_06315 [Microlunatus sp. Gsoil 973]
MNTFATSGWAEPSNHGGQPNGRQSESQDPDRIDLRAPADPPDGNDSRRARPLVAMLTRPLVDWLPDLMAGEPDTEASALLDRWADAVLAWSVPGPVRMIITRAEPATAADLAEIIADPAPTADPLRAAALGGHEGGDHESGDDQTGESRAGLGGFRSRIEELLRSRKGGADDLDLLRSKAAVEAVAYGTSCFHPWSGPAAGTGPGEQLHHASLAVRERLVSGGIAIRGPRTALLWPQQAGEKLPLDVAAEAALAALLCRTDPIADAGAGEDGTVVAELRHELREATRRLADRRQHPGNLKRVRLRTLLHQLLRATR